MSININETRNWILGIVMGIILIVSGFVMVNVLHVIGGYIVASVNQTISQLGTPVQPLITQQQIQIVGLSLMMGGITLVIISVAMMIKVILSSIERTGT